MYLLPGKKRLLVCFIKMNFTPIFFHETEILLKKLIVLIFAHSFYFIVLHMSVNWIIVFEFIYAK